MHEVQEQLVMWGLVLMWTIKLVVDITRSRNDESPPDASA